MTSWNFGTLESGWKGHGNAAQGHFRDSRYQSLAREVIQNSLDVIDNKNEVMTVEFKCYKKSVSEIPDYEGLREALDKCRQEAESKGKQNKPFKFYSNAIELLDSGSIYVLEVSESNTTGMPGPNELGQPFYAYMQAEGEGQKDDTSTGSHGVGKAAKLVVSDLRTLFVSTRYQDHSHGGEVVSLCQGKARLQSFYKPNGKVSDSDGFWGPDGTFDPVSDKEKIPNWMTRNSVGTSFFILGFTRVPNWQNRLIASVVENFFVAILDRKLRVRVEDTIVDADTIQQLAEDVALEQSVADTPGQPESFQNTSHFIRAYIDSNNILENTQQGDQLGNCSVTLSVHPGAPNRVCLIRNGMLITTSLDGLKQFRNVKDFVALIQCESKKGNQFIRSLENIKHDKVSPEELDDVRAQKKASSALKKLSKSVKTLILKHAAIESQGAGDISFVSGLFSDESSADDSFKSTETNPSGELKWSLKKTRPRVNRTPVYDETQNDPPGIPPTPPTPPTPPRVAHKPIPLNDVRVIKTGSNQLKIFFSTNEPMKILLSVYVAGAEEDELLIIEKISGPGRVIDGKARVSCEAGRRNHVELTLASVPQCAFKVMGEMVQ